MKKCFPLLAVGICAAMSGSAFAATQLQGVDIYVTGSKSDFSGGGGLGNFSPGAGLGPNGTAAELQMFDDGTTNGDLVADDGIWTAQVENLTPGDQLVWKVASSGFNPVNTPNDNNYVVVPGSGTVTFYLQSAVQDDGFVPDTLGGGTPDGYVYTDQTASIVAGATVGPKVVGSFQTENGGAADWSPTDAGALLLTDAAAGGLADGLYGATLTGIPSGVYNFKVVINDDFAPAAFGLSGYASAGGDFSFTVLDSSNVVTFVLDANEARVSASNPALSAGPPFYAQSSAWGTGFSSLEDLGSATGNVYSKVFTVATPGNYNVRVVQGLGSSFPDSGAYPFATTSPNQEVLVVFDRNTYTDGYSPDTDIVLVLDNATRAGLTTWSNVQPVGNWMTEVGGTDWSNNDAAFTAPDSGVAPDAVAGDNVHSVEYTVLSAPAEINGEMKTVATPSYDAGADRWKYQFGGDGEGVTQQGNNDPIVFNYANGDKIQVKIDTISGRVAVAAGASPSIGEPDRSASYWSLTSVNNWTMY